MAQYIKRAPGVIAFIRRDPGFREVLKKRPKRSGSIVQNLFGLIELEVQGCLNFVLSRALRIGRFASSTLG
jgi:hypothetical protein